MGQITTASFLPIPRSNRRSARHSSLLAAAALASLAACGGGGSGSSAPTAGFGFFEFDLRTDVSVANSGLIDGALVDLDGDGLVDLVACDFEDHVVAVGGGMPDGTFPPAAFLSTPAAPWTLAAADFGGDGRMDLAIACIAVLPGETNSVVLFEQSSTGLYLKTDVFALPSAPFDVSPGALLDNGRAQVLVSLLGERQTLVLDLVAPGTLATVQTLDSSAIASGAQHSVEALDFDHDGDVDVVGAEIGVEGGAPDRLVVWRNDGAGVLGDAELVLSGLLRPLLSQTGDVDLDGFPDLAVAQMDGTAVVLLETRASAPPEMTGQEMGAGTSSALFRDLDGDGLPEVAATQWKRQTLAVRSGIGPGLFGDLRQYNVGSAPRNVAAVLLPGDAALDLACVNIGDVSLLYQKKGEFVAARGYDLGAAAATLACADLDQDGSYDALTLDAGAGKVVVMSGHSDGTFEKAGTISVDPALAFTPGFLCVAELTGDELPDLVVSVLDADEVRVYPNTGGQEFGAPAAGQIVSVGDEPGGLAAGDLDGDGDQDLLVANAGDHTYQPLLRQSDSSLQAGAAIAVGGRPNAALLADLDGDARLDLALSAGEKNGTDNRLLIFAGQSGTNFELAFEQPLVGPAVRLATGDFDEDGRIDLVASQSTIASKEVFVLLNRGALDFETVVVPVGYGPGSVSVGDVNEDGHDDLICPLSQGMLRLVLGDGHGAFPTLLPTDGSGVELPVPYDTTASAFADVDLDGKNDLLLVTPATPLLWVAANRTVVPGN